MDALAPSSSSHRVEDLARDYVEVIRRQDPVGPYRLLGFSFAGLVAYEAALQLVASGAEVPLVVLIDSTLPEYVGGWRFRLNQLGRLLAAPPRDVAAFVVRRIQERVRESGFEFKEYADDDRLGPLEERRVLANLRAAEHYTRRLRRFPGDVTLIISGGRLRNDPLKSPSCGWDPYVASLAVHKLDADHFHLMERDPHVSQVASIIAARI
jgi:thioesterase domain-containing protein